MRPTFLHGAVVTAVLSVAACGVAKEKQPEAAAATPAATPAAAADSTAKAASVDSAAKVGAAPKKAQGPLRDSAGTPKFTVDSNGKVTPIKPPAKRP